MRKDHRVRELALKDKQGSYTKRYKENGKRYFTKEYSLWHNMTNRVNSSARHEKDPKYNGCSLGFTDYDQFVDWCREQIGFKNEGWVIDKDIMCDFLNLEVKTYSPTTCLFIPIVINSFLTFSNRSTNTTGYVGVSKIKDSKYRANFMVCATNLDGINTTLGRTNTVEEGYQLYRNHKLKLAKILADTYKGEVDPRVTDYLENFDKYIDGLAIFNNNRGE